MKKNQKINYKNTINLPKINFPMKGNLTNKEPQIIKKWNEINLYYKIRKNKKNKKKFIIHDGPPYANGQIHIGHAFNKILKDIILKYKNFMNFNTPYTPGWDCHGLPIELEIQKKYKNKINSIKEIKKFKYKCFKYVKKQIKIQKKNFIRLGIIANWKNCYKTMEFKNIANTIRILKKIIKLKLLKRKKKPTNWCLKCNSSLAEAEIEYKNKISTAIYLTFKLNYSQKNFFYKNILKKNINKKNIYFVIWTTTPWTIPGNCAISIHPNYKYSIIENNQNILILSKKKKKKITKIIKSNYKTIKEIKGKKLSIFSVIHPISKKKTPIILDKKIIINTGTGIVHIASEHGEEDFLLCKKNKISGLNVITNNSKYIKYNFIKNIGKKKLKKAEKKILNILIKKKKILFKEKITHKYPHCWRHKKPIILRTTSQWFINLNNKKFKKKILQSIKKVKWNPSWGYKKIKNMIINRPDWCISRQRYWGTPIPIFINKKNNKIHPKTIKLMDLIILKIEKYGPNYWLDVKPEQFKINKKKYKKVLDILDVWFDSGSTCNSIMNKKFNKIKHHINLYVEGSDQYRGWFMSSLIINNIINNCAPYKEILSHGFIVDEQGKKMSKSLKNSINPQIITDKYGADILRLWVASTKFTKEIHISNDIILQISNKYRKIRNTIKFIISNLDEFNPKNNLIPKNKMVLLDKWIIHKAKKTQNKILLLYKKFKFYKVTKKIFKFCNLYLSSIYLNIIKDRKYTIKKNTLPYLSVQTTLWILIETIVKWIAPILSFTAEEIWNYLPRKKPSSIYKETWFKKLFYIHKNNNINIKIWNKLIIIKVNLNKKIEILKCKKKINSTLETKIILYLEKNFFKKIKKIKSELKFFFLTSKLDIKIKKHLNKNNFFQIKCKKHKGKKCQRCWHYVNKLISNKIYTNICKRCIKNLSGQGENRKFI